MWRARMAARIEQLGRYTAPADRVVYDDDPARMRELLGHPNYDYFPGNWETTTPRYVYFDDLGGRGANIGVNPRGHAVLFLHHLRDQAGQTAVVEVFLDPWDQLGQWDRPGARRVWNLGAGVVVPVGYARYDMLQLDGDATYADVLPFSIDDPRSLRIFAGQPGQHDHSRFTIRYEIGSEHGVVEGRLAEGGRVELIARPTSAGVTTGVK
jgi:hypothetical protein